MNNQTEKIALQKKETRKQVLAARDSIPLEERTRKSREICDQLIQMLDGLQMSHSQQLIMESQDSQGSQMAGNSFARRTPRSVAVYHAMKSEVDLDRFIREAYARDIQVYFPCMMKETRTNVSRETFGSSTPAEGCPSQSSMVFRKVSTEAYINDTATFIANPLKSFAQNDIELEAFPRLKDCKANSLDMIVVPLVAFDEANNRLGYGGGNYDQFLTTVSSNADASPTATDCPDASTHSDEVRCSDEIATIIVGVGFAEQKIEQVPVDTYDQRLPQIICA